MSPLRICLVSPGHVSSNPRLVKSADALTAAGHVVTVVHLGGYAPALQHDAGLHATRRWQRVTAWRGPESLIYRLARLCQLVSARLAGLGWHRADARAQYLWHDRLCRMAAACPADIYIGHNLAALPVVAAVAARRGVPWAFDVEDFHPGERPGAGPDDHDWQLADRLLRRHLPAAALVTAASPLIAQEVTARYGVPALSILNTFALAPSLAGPAADGLRLYWFSQTVGPGRGLEAMIAVLAAMQLPLTLAIRGSWQDGYADVLRTAIGSAPITLALLETAAADDMIVLAQGYDAGLSCELPDCLNKELCLGNKIFTCLAAGTPVILSATRAQRQLAADMDSPGVLLIDMAEPQQAAAQLRDWLQLPLASRAAAAATLARARYSWPHDAAVLVRAVEAAAGDRAGGG